MQLSACPFLLHKSQIVKFRIEIWAFLGAQLVKNLPAARETWVQSLGSISGLGRSLGEGKSYILQYSGLENSMDSMVHGVAKSWIWLNNFHFSSLQDQNIGGSGNCQFLWVHFEGHACNSFQSQTQITWRCSSSLLHPRLCFLQPYRYGKFIPFIMPLLNPYIMFKISKLALVWFVVMMNELISRRYIKIFLVKVYSLK